MKELKSSNLCLQICSGSFLSVDAILFVYVFVAVHFADYGIEFTDLDSFGLVSG